MSESSGVKHPCLSIAPDLGRASVMRRSLGKDDVTAVIARPRAGVGLSGNASWVIYRERGNTFVTVEGELDSASAGAIASALAPAGATAAEVTVDLSGVDFIDLAGLGALERVHRLFEILGAFAVLAGAVVVGWPHAPLVGT
jgi:anti-anti-sigma factor